jgi:cytochrome c oxidase subunit 3
MNSIASPSAPARDELTGSMGMWVFLASEVLFFGGLLVAYTYGRSHWPDGFAAASHETHVAIGTVNTALLLTSSAFVASAGAAKRHVETLLAAACALGVAFMVLKGVEYAKEWHEHLVPGASFRLHDVPGAQLFFVLYFLTTGLHAVHLTIGIAVLAVFAWGSHRVSPWASPRRVEVAGLYWHFVDVVWIFLYPLIYLAGRSS